MDTAIYTIIGFITGASTCYFSYKLGSDTVKGVYEPVEVAEKREYETTTTEDQGQYDWDGYSNSIKYGDEPEEPKA